MTIPVVLMLMLLLSTSGWALQCENGDLITTESLLDSALETILYSGTELVFVKTTMDTLYRSADEGVTFTKITTAQMANSSGNVYSAVATADPLSVWFFGSYSSGGPYWTTSDGGLTFKWHPSPAGYILRNALPHPTRTKTAAFRAASSSFTGSPALLVTSDLGETWTVVDTNIDQDFAWARASGTDDWNTILYSKLADPTTSQGFTGCLGKCQLQRYNVVDRTRNTELQRVISFHDHYWSGYADSLDLNPQHFYFVTQRDAETGSALLLVSNNWGLSWVTAKFPTGVDPTDFSMLDATEKAIFLNIPDENSASGTLYVAGSDLAFVESLRHQKRHPTWTDGVDFERVQGLQGIYFANVYRSDGDTINNDQVISYMTFDKGAEWIRLTPPTRDSNNDPIPCLVGECYLNLRGIVDGDVYGRFYSVPAAIGILIGTGSVGAYLPTDTASTEINTYMSRDAGLTWTEIKKGKWTYEMGDHGGLLVVGQRGTTKNISWSYDEGLTWHTCQAVSNEYILQNIVVETAFASQNFLAYGTRNSQREGVLVHLSFTQLHERKCNTSDYEYWSPSDHPVFDPKKTCLMGLHYEYERRIQKSECANDRNWQPNVVESPCPCSDLDYSCDFCYEDKKDGNGCQLVCAASDAIGAMPPVPCVGTYQKTQGYRLVVDDGCSLGFAGSLNKLPVTTPCPTDSTSTGSSTTTTGSSTTAGSTTGSAANGPPSAPAVPQRGSAGAVVGIIVMMLLLGVIIAFTVMYKMRRPAAIYNGLNPAVEWANGKIVGILAKVSAGGSGAGAANTQASGPRYHRVGAEDAGRGYGHGTGFLDEEEQ